MKAIQIIEAETPKKAFSQMPRSIRQISLLSQAPVGASFGFWPRARQLWRVERTEVGYHGKDILVRSISGNKTLLLSAAMPTFVYPPARPYPRVRSSPH